MMVRIYSKLKNRRGRIDVSDSFSKADLRGPSLPAIRGPTDWQAQRPSIAGPWGNAPWEGGPWARAYHPSHRAGPRLGAGIPSDGQTTVGGGIFRQAGPAFGW